MDLPSNDALQEMHGPDFSLLPDVVWVRVMTYLSLGERNCLSQTCHTLNAVFRHPSLWRTVKITFLGASCNFFANHSFVPVVFKRMTEHFGHLFQDLTLVISGYLINLDEESREVIRLLGKHCRLESLMLEVGKITNNYHLYGLQPDKNDLHLLLAFIKNAFRLRRLHIVSWPMHPDLFADPRNNIFEVMKANSKLTQSLETLSLFWQRDAEWCERHPLMPTPDYIEELVAAFPSLTSLALRSPLLSTPLLQTLARSSRPPLKLMEIFVMYSPHDITRAIPELSTEVWSQLTKRSASLRVECTVMSRTPSLELDQLLRVSVPLRSLTLLKYAICDAHLLGMLASKFDKTLERFVCLCDTDDLGDELVRLVSRCQSLTSLVFRGKIHHSSVETIARLRGPNWTQLVFSRANVSTLERREQPGLDEDEVIARNADGDLYLVDLHRFHQTDDQREEHLDGMVQAVSQSLKKTWVLAD